MPKGQIRPIKCFLPKYDEKADLPKHNIPLGSVIEITLDEYEGWKPETAPTLTPDKEYRIERVELFIKGTARLVVVGHRRDNKDGTPVYVVSTRPIGMGIGERGIYYQYASFFLTNVEEWALRPTGKIVEIYESVKAYEDMCDARWSH
jgi:hypothetical protein